MSGICSKRSANARRIAALPRKVRPTGSGPRARQKVASSAKQSTMRSTSRLLNAAEILCISSIVTIALYFPNLSLRGAEATKQSPAEEAKAAGDCFASLAMTTGSAGRPRAPQDVARAAVIDPAAQHEQVIGQPVQVFDR